MKPKRPTKADLDRISKAGPWLINCLDKTVSPYEHKGPNAEAECESATRTLNWLATPEGLEVLEAGRIIDAVRIWHAAQVIRGKHRNCPLCAMLHKAVLGKKSDKSSYAGRRASVILPRAAERGGEETRSATSMCNCGHRKVDHGDEMLICWARVGVHVCPCNSFTPKPTSRTKRRKR